MKHLVLALDGGGVRLLLQWAVLKRITTRFPRLLAGVTFFAGTSAGSILAAALACKMEDLVEKVVNPANLVHVFGHRDTASLCGLVKAKYHSDALRKMLENHFGAVAMQDVPRGLFIPAFAVNGNDKTQREHAKKDDDPEWMNRRCKAR